MNTHILKALLLIFSVASIITLGARSQIAKNSQSFTENVRFPKSNIANSSEVEPSESEYPLDDTNEQEVSNVSAEVVESSEPSTLTESAPEVFDPRQPNQDDQWYAFDSSTNSIVIAKSRRTPGAIKGFDEEEDPAPELRALIYKKDEFEADVTATGFRGIPGVSTGPVEVFDDSCIAALAHQNVPCEVTSKTTGVRTEITQVKKHDPPREFEVNQVMIKMVGSQDSEAIILISENLHTVIDINRDGFPDFWHSYSWHASGAQNSGLHYSITENGKLIRYETVEYLIPGC